MTLKKRFNVSAIANRPRQRHRRQETLQRASRQRGCIPCILEARRSATAATTTSIRRILMTLVFLLQMAFLHYSNHRCRVHQISSCADSGPLNQPMRTASHHCCQSYMIAVPIMIDALMTTKSHLVIMTVLSSSAPLDNLNPCLRHRVWVVEVPPPRLTMRTLQNDYPIDLVVVVATSLIVGIVEMDCCATNPMM